MATPDYLLMVARFTCRIHVSSQLFLLIKLDDQAFETCSGLASLTLPDTLTDIGVGAFNTVVTHNTHDKLIHKHKHTGVNRVPNCVRIVRYAHEGGAYLPMSDHQLG